MQAHIIIIINRSNLHNDKATKAKFVGNNKQDQEQLNNINLTKFFQPVISFVNFQKISSDFIVNTLLIITLHYFIFYIKIIYSF